MASSDLITVEPVEPRIPEPPTAPDISVETQQKSKGRQRIVHGLHRFASSPSLSRIGRFRSSSLSSKPRGEGFSCVSTSSLGQCAGSSESPFVANYEGSLPARLVQTSGSDVGKASSVPLPAEFRPSSSQCTTREVVDEGEGNGTTSIPVDTEMETDQKWSVPFHTVDAAKFTPKFHFWYDMPMEIRLHILHFLSPKEIVRCSRVSKTWNCMCFDGKLWSIIESSTFYRDIPPEAFLKLALSAGPFLRELKLRGCIQFEESWATNGELISNMCRNLTTFSINQCNIDRQSVQYFLSRNQKLAHVSLPALMDITNSTMELLAQSCPRLETLDLSWCRNINGKGLRHVVAACPRLKELDVTEVKRLSDRSLMLELFKSNSLETLIMSRSSLTDAALKILCHGENPEIDVLTNIPIVPHRKLKHLNITHCRNITDEGLRKLAHCTPDLESLRVSHSDHVTDESLIEIVQTTPKLSYLELEEVTQLTNRALIGLSKAPCATVLEHLNLSSCENIGDPGVVPLLQVASRLKGLSLDSTCITDLSMAELCANAHRAGFGTGPPSPGLWVEVFDCSGITWVGIREVLSTNTFTPWKYKSPPKSTRPGPMGEGPDLVSTSDSLPLSLEYPSQPQNPQLSIALKPQLYPREIIQLRCNCQWQNTVNEHTRRVLRGDFIAARRWERRWADFMMANEENQPRGFMSLTASRRRRRLRELMRLYDEEEIDDGTGGLEGNDEDDELFRLPGYPGYLPSRGRRRRARSAGIGCTLM